MNSSEPTGQDAVALEQNPPLRVLIADDDPLAVRLLAEYLTGDGLQIIGTAPDGDSAVEETLRLTPDVVVIDADLSGCGALTATERIRVNAPEVQVVVLAVGGDQDLVMSALRAGAAGFLDKNIDLDGLARAVRGIARGEAALDRRMTRRLIEEFRRLSSVRRPGAVTQSGGSQLSPRERQILSLLALDRETQEISDELGLTRETVRTHVKSILRKLRVHTRAEAIEVGHRRGLLDSSVREAV